MESNGPFHLLVEQIYTLKIMSKKSTSTSGSTVGIVFLLVGIVFLIRQADWFEFPEWLFTWPVLLIVVGLVSGISSSFQGNGWFWPLIIGSIFLIDHEFVEVDIFEYTLPLVFILIGISMVLKTNRKANKKSMGREDSSGQSGTGSSNAHFSIHDEPFIAISSVLSSRHLKVTNQDFKGANLTNILAGMEIDLSQVEFEGVSIQIELTQILSGVTIYVPANWEIRQHYTTLLAGFEDKRNTLGNNLEGEKKILYLNGIQALSGIEIKDIR